MSLKKFGVSNGVALILGFISLIASVFGVFFFFDNRYASAKDTDMKMQKVVTSVDKLSNRLDYNLIEDRIFKIKERIAKIKSQYPNASKMPKIVSEELLELETQKDKLENKVKIMEQNIEGLQ